MGRINQSSLTPLVPNMKKINITWPLFAGPIIYFVSGLLIISTNMGSHPWSIGFSNIMQSVVPSIAGTAIHAPEPANARLLISLAWFMGPIHGLFLGIFYYHHTKLVDWEHVRNKKWSILFAVVGSILLLLALTYATPSPESIGPSGRFVYQVVHGSMFSLLLLEAGFVLMYSSIFFMQFSIVRSVFRRTFSRTFKGDNT